MPRGTARPLHAIGVVGDPSDSRDSRDSRQPSDPSAATVSPSQRSLRAVLGTLFDDPLVTEIMVNAGDVWIERSGALERVDAHLDAEVVDRLIETMVTDRSRRVDRSSPIVDTRLDDGSRVSIVVPPVAVDGPCITIRRFRAVPVALSELAAPPLVELLLAALDHRLNIVVVGSAGSGKTTVLNALLGRLGAAERLITVEDAAELQIGSPHVVRLETRPASADGVGDVSVRSLVRAALRMRPDRIIVGEVRGAEAADMCQAMHTGHDGSMTTCHANGPDDALLRLESMVLTGAASMPAASVRRMLASAIDLLVWVRRTGEAERRVEAIHEVRPATNGGEPELGRICSASAVERLPSVGSRRVPGGLWWR